MALGTLVWLSAAFGVSLPHAASAVTAVRTAAVRTMVLFTVLVFIVFPPGDVRCLSVTLGRRLREANR